MAIQYSLLINKNNIATHGDVVFVNYFYQRYNEIEQSL